MISNKDVKYMAQLARLDIKEAEVEKLRKDLSAVLDYVEILKKADVSGVEPTSHPLKIENVMRKDEVLKFSEKLIDGYLKVKSIF